tara:strand:+ start:3166 stop:3921 length:756 start_codon:yes stop_codon:yes gene_type:complete
MDGTLTPPREKITRKVIAKLRELSSFSRIGIISGSDLDYIKQQCWDMFEMGGVPIDNVDILPCNGTKLLRWKNSSFYVDHEADMLKNIGAVAYRKILSHVFTQQASIAMLYPDLPFTGTFFQYRGSLLNWCPIGRVANLEQRAAWKKWDKEYHIREVYMQELQKYISDNNIAVTVALGGTTSFDIYPHGWDKTYGLQHYENTQKFFIGDRCEEGGNDWHIYKELEPSGNAWCTQGPDNTIEIIDKLISKLK